MEKLIALDVDGVMNGGVDHTYLETVESAEYVLDKHMPERFKHILAFYRTNYYGWGHWVNILRVDRVREIIESNNAEVIGTSSWFTRHERKSLSEFFQFPITHINGYTGGGEWRCKHLAEFVLEHRPKHLLILDDQWFGWRAYGLEEYRVKDMNGIEDHHVPKAHAILAKEVDYKKLEIAYERQMKHLDSLRV